MSKPMGRPPAEIDPAKLQALMRLKPTLEDTAAFFECHPRTVERFIRENFDLSFAEFRDRGMVHTRMELIRLALKKADKSDTMHKFCLKNLAGWVELSKDEVPQVSVHNTNVAEDKLSDEQMAKLLRVARGEE
jgi:hypothetical protein